MSEWWWPPGGSLSASTSKFTVNPLKHYCPKNTSKDSLAWSKWYFLKILSGSFFVTLEESCESSVQGEGRDGRRTKYLSGDRSTDNLKAQKRPKNQGQKQHEERIRWNVQGQSLRRRRLKHGGEGGGKNTTRKRGTTFITCTGPPPSSSSSWAPRMAEAPISSWLESRPCLGTRWSLRHYGPQPIRDYFGRTTENTATA